MVISPHWARLEPELPVRIRRTTQARATLAVPLGLFLIVMLPLAALALQKGYERGRPEEVLLGILLFGVPVGVFVGIFLSSIAPEEWELGPNRARRQRRIVGIPVATTIEDAEIRVRHQRLRSTNCWIVELASPRGVTLIEDARDEKSADDLALFLAHATGWPSRDLPSS